MTSPSLPALILAAGSGQRLGGPKALRIWEGETLLQRAARQALAAGCSPVIAVIGPWPVDLRDDHVRILPNAQAAEGMASSIRAGVAALPADAQGVLLLTVDQIRMDEPFLRRMLDMFFEAPGQPVASAYAGTVGIPAVVPRRLFQELLSLRGDRGAKQILLQENTRGLPFPGGEEDLDTPQDLEAFRR